MAAEVLHRGTNGPHACSIVRYGDYTQRGFRPVKRWHIIAACGFDATDWTEAAALAAYDEHTHPGLAEAYLPTDAPLPWKDAP